MGKRLRKTFAGMFIVISVVVMMSYTALAGSGNILFGGMNVSWNISSAVMTTNMKTSYIADLESSGDIYQMKGDIKTKLCIGSAWSTNNLTFNSYPDRGYSFIKHSANKMTVYVNGSAVTSYSPQP